ncbi:hypothetical protein GPECTOR_169g182 [Gonium pectorale]|uniref:Uncharacterized protein n=1 Tax=Gonium pectorale TaxID=33097 RepID=A0A150FXG7_GONPE|nr:hypothetical protein GPECTOR_169g182 [Gonium pectorale]|eukprot:KXZ42278.1 hypothetical protein GPECTOR_169g182 [Gonium pectorale]
MATEFIHTMFPQSAYYAATKYPDHYKYFFPDDTQSLCSPSALEDNADEDEERMLMFRWTTLIVVYMTGIISMLLYSLVNVAALCCFSLIPRTSLMHVPFILLNIATSAGSAFCAAYACWTGELGRVSQRSRNGKAGSGVSSEPSANTRNSRRIHRVFLYSVCLGFFVLAFFGFSVIPMLSESVIVGTALLATASVGVTVLTRWPLVGRQWLSFAIIALGLAVAVGGAAADVPLCKHGYAYAVSGMSIIYFGYHVIMTGLLHYVHQDLSYRTAAAV